MSGRGLRTSRAAPRARLDRRPTAEGRGAPVRLMTSGCCEVRLFIEDEEILSECLEAFRAEGGAIGGLPQAPPLSIVTHEDGRGWESWRARLRANGGRRARISWNDHLAVYYVLEAESRSVHVWGEPGEARFGTAAIHAAREWAMLWIERAYGGIAFHASAVSRSGAGLLFSGDKKAGKTSTLLAFLDRGGYDFVANDRVFLRRIEGAWIVLGFPYWLKIRPDTLRHFPRLQSVPVLKRTEDEVLAALGVRPSRVAALRGIFFCRFDASLGEPLVRRLPAEETYRHLRRNLLRPEKSFMRRMLLPLGPGPKDRPRALRALSEEVPGYRLVHSIEKLPATVRAVENAIGGPT